LEEQRLLEGGLIPMNDDEIEQLVREAIDAWLAPEDRTAAHEWLTRLAERNQTKRRGGGGAKRDDEFSD
jgi:hypothetical protein